MSATVEHDDDPLAVWARVWQDYGMTWDDARAAGDPELADALTTAAA